MSSQPLHRPDRVPRATQLPRGETLAEEIERLYRAKRSEMGQLDLDHIANVAAYSRAIDERARELITRGRSPRQVWRGAVLRGLHILLEFSELGHNILHGSYDELEALAPGTPFHSERWRWDFVTDEREWQVMHHENHHPHTNVVGKDHDLGYSVARWMSGQNWYAHHATQSALLLAFVVHIYPFALYTGTSAARTEGRPVLARETFRKGLRRIGKHLRKNYITEPRAAGLRAPQTLLGNYLGTVLGYDLTMLVLFIEHHAEDVELYHDPGPSETHDEFYERQLRATTNFTGGGRFDAYLSSVLEEEVPFPERPDFRVFYGGLDTHIEHHLFPDLPCQRQREVAEDVRAIAERRDIPYNVRPLEPLVRDLVLRFGRYSVPRGQGERVGDLLRRPRAFARRIVNGLRYRPPSEGHGADAYMTQPRTHEVDARVHSTRELADGDAVTIEFQRPEGWAGRQWPAGAFVSVRIEVAGEAHVRQYSLLDESEEGEWLNIAVRRVPGGAVSNHLIDEVRSGDTLRLVGPPEATGGLAQVHVPERALYLAGGVGITPILSMLRRRARVAPECQATLLYFNRNEETALFTDELRAMKAERSGLELHFFVDGPQDAINRGRLNSELISERCGEVQGHEVYICGPVGFIDAARDALAELGVPRQAIHVELFESASPQQAVTGRTHEVVLTRSGVQLVVDEGQTLLAAARAAGVVLPSGCERGLCRACACTKRAGQTTTADVPHDGFGRVTLCNSYPRSPLQLDA